MGEVSVKGPIVGHFPVFIKTHRYTHIQHDCRNRPVDAFMVQISQDRAPETDVKRFNELIRATTNQEF